MAIPTRGAGEPDLMVRAMQEVNALANIVVEKNEAAQRRGQTGVEITRSNEAVNEAIERLNMRIEELTPRILREFSTLKTPATRGHTEVPIHQKLTEPSEREEWIRERLRGVVQKAVTGLPSKLQVKVHVLAEEAPMPLPTRKTETLRKQRIAAFEVPKQPPETGISRATPSKRAEATEIPESGALATGARTVSAAVSGVISELTPRQNTTYKAIETAIESRYGGTTRDLLKIAAYAIIKGNGSLNLEEIQHGFTQTTVDKFKRVLPETEFADLMDGIRLAPSAPRRTEERSMREAKPKTRGAVSTPTLTPAPAAATPAPAMRAAAVATERTVEAGATKMLDTAPLLNDLKEILSNNPVTKTIKVHEYLEKLMGLFKTTKAHSQAISSIYFDISKLYIKGKISQQEYKDALVKIREFCETNNVTLDQTTIDKQIEALRTHVNHEIERVKTRPGLSPQAKTSIIIALTAAATFATYQWMAMLRDNCFEDLRSIPMSVCGGRRVSLEECSNLSHLAAPYAAIVGMFTYTAGQLLRMARGGS